MFDLTEFNLQADLKPGPKSDSGAGRHAGFAGLAGLARALLTGLLAGFLAGLITGCAVLPPSSTVAFAGDSAPVHGHLYLPRSAGPHPVVIDLHGCNGIWRARNRLWLPRLLDAGFAVFQIDSLTLRGVTNICADGFRVAPMTRGMDTASALRWILRDERFRRDAVFLIGMSHGGTTSLLTQLGSHSVFSNLKGVVAFYPYCYDVLPVLNADLLVLVGEHDDWTPAARCRDMRIGDRAGHSYELVVYPGAHHSFDVPGRDGVYFGHRIRYDKAASDDSIRRVMSFLKDRI